MTTAYQLSFDIVEKLKSDKEILDSVLYEKNKVIQLINKPYVEFDKAFEDLIEILRQIELEKPAAILENEMEQVPHEDLFVRFLSEKNLEKLKDSFLGSSKKKILKICETQDELTDYYGEAIDSDELDYYLDSYDDFLKLIDSAIKNNETILFVTSA